jgi:hypothetical protein
MVLAVLRCQFILTCVFVLHAAAAWAQPKKGEDAKKPPGASAAPASVQAQPSNLAAQFNQQLVPVVQATQQFSYCADVAVTLHKRQPPPGFLEKEAIADRAHNLAVARKDALHKSESPRPIAPAHEDYRRFLEQGEALLRKCGDGLGAYTTRMLPHLQSIHDVLHQSEGKISPADARKVADTLANYDAQHERFVVAIADISDDPHLQGHLHEVIMHVIKQTTPPAHGKR